MKQAAQMKQTEKPEKTQKIEQLEHLVQPDNSFWSVSRREVLALSASMVAALSLDGLMHANPGHATEIRFPEGRCGGKKMKKNVLVAYASKYGSTGGVADAIAKELCAAGWNADTSLIKNVRNLGAYQGVVVGSAIYMGKWMPEAFDFLKANRETLGKMSVAYFIACISMARPDEKKRAEALSYTDSVMKAVPEIKPVSVGTFAGALNYGNLSWAIKPIMKAKGAPEGDFRDWNAIRGWTRDALYTKFAV